MFPRLYSTYVGHAKAWQYYERRIIRTFESRRLWAELCHDGREELVLIRTWYLKLGAGSWQCQVACCCEWRCFRRDADASDVNSSGVPWTCRNLTGQTLQMIKSGDRYSYRDVLKSLRKWPFIFLNCFFFLSS